MATANKTSAALVGEPCWIGICSAIEMTKAAAGPSSTRGYVIGTFLQAMRSGMVGFSGTGKKRRQDAAFWQNAALENVFDEQGIVDVRVAHTFPEPDTDENAGSSWRRAHTVTCIGTAIDRDDLADWLQRHLQHEGRAAIVDYKVGAPGRPDHSAAKSGSFPAVERARQKKIIAWIVCQRANQPAQRGESDLNSFIRSATLGTFNPPIVGGQTALRASWNELFSAVKKRGPISDEAWPKYVKISQDYLAEHGCEAPTALPTYLGVSGQPTYSYPPNF